MAPISRRDTDNKPCVALQSGLKRGSKLFFRHYLGPITFRGGETFVSL